MTQIPEKTRIFVAGHGGMVGSAIVRQLEKDPSIDIITKGRSELDLTNQAQVQQFFAETPIDQVYLAAAKVGGIYANNTYPADFIFENLMIEANVINSAHQANVKKLLFLGSSCIYPRDAVQPMQEDVLLTGKLEPTNEQYAVAKIAGIKLCEAYNRQYGHSDGVDYRSVMPTNLYGVGDNYHPDNSHVIPGLIRRIHEAKSKAHPAVVIWGSGNPRREFLYVDDMARASVFVMNMPLQKYREATSEMCSHVNVGQDKDMTIRQLAESICSAVGYQGSLEFDTSKPDGMPRKLLDSSLIRSLGWQPSVTLEDGLAAAYADFLANHLA